MNEEHAEKVYMIREVTAIQKLNMDVQAASDRLATIESGDILVTATTATEPIIHGAEIKKGVYVAHLGNNEVDEELILRAVWGMMPHGKLGRAQFRKLKVYAGDLPQHQYVAQGAQPLTLKNQF